MEVHDPVSRSFTMTHVSLDSYIRLTLLVSMCLGVVAGLLLFLIGDIVGIDISFRIGWFFIDSQLLGIVMLFISPFVFAAVGFVGSLASYSIFLRALGNIDGIRIDGRWRERPSPSDGRFQSDDTATTPLSIAKVRAKQQK